MAISVLTFNVRKLQVPGVPAKTIVEQIAGQDADVLLFQEVFNGGAFLLPFARNAKKLLRRALEPAGWRVFWSRASGVLGVRDGLMVALRGSRFDLDEGVFDPRRHVIETVLDSGIFEKRIALGVIAKPRGEERPWLFADTHLTYGQRQPDRIESRRRQVAALLPFLTAAEEEFTPSAVVLGGDFNAHGEADPEGPQSEAIRDLLGGDLRDAYRELHAFGDDLGATFDPESNAMLERHRGLEAPARYDYLFFRPTDGSVRVTDARVVLKEDPATGRPLSDHYGVRAVFETGTP